MAKIFVTSDLHFDHNNIVKLAYRPFNDVKEMNEKIIENWNNVVKLGDIVYILGDITMGKSAEVVFGFLKRLNGNMTIIKGNHDRQSVSDIQYLERKEYERDFVMFHYPIEEWNGSHRGSIHLHGHTHSNIKSDKKNRYNVCLEANDYTPVELKSIIEYFEKEEQ